MKLNIGDHGAQHDGYTGIDIARGEDAASIGYPDGYFEEVRASHVLEHFSHHDVLAALKEWVRVLKPGGCLKVAVPDFKTIAQAYIGGKNMNFQGFIMGGQTDAHDFHRALFDYEVLSEALREVGLIGIRHWQDEIEDCSRYPISLNLCGTKPPASWPKVAAVISVPRLGFNDFWACAYKDLGPIMPLRKVTGAYWDRDLTLAIDESLEAHDPEWILTADYDTVFTRSQVFSLLELATRYPEADAIAPLQTSRHHDQPMFTARGEDGRLLEGLSRDDLTRGEVIRAETAHFGLTLLRASKLKELPRPWFNRTYGEGGCDPDVQFWHNWKAAGNSLFIALRVPVGHCELMVRWPNVNLEPAYQRPSEFQKEGAPEEVWR